mmetsp:Transcript_12409/g.19651  ORF Transcript_12409/g.19651 Transcript_12409/m.19651 type:complete len:115 (+) Transcript_12409:2-346(+)
MAEMDARMKQLLNDIEGRQSAEVRLVTATTLMALLDPASASYDGEAGVDAFLGAGGPSILRYRLDSMDGVSLAVVALTLALLLFLLARSCLLLSFLLSFLLPIMSALLDFSRSP